jgi:DNA uptake protein ComE-like DNA-binding protein
MIWKDFFYFTRSERRGIILLVALIIIVTGGNCLVSAYRKKSEIAGSVLSGKGYAGLNDSLHTKRKKPTTYDRPAKERIAIVPTLFDPNTADSLTFLRLGLSPRTASNIIRYRMKGGKFRRPEDFKRIYGLTPEQYAGLLPYISIQTSFDTKKKDTLQPVFKPEPAREPLPVAFKYPLGTVIDINQADTAELKKIPGIGSGIAASIVTYRKRLGGFYSIHQLEDIHLPAVQFAEWFSVAADSIVRINLNKTGIERLRAHPYFNFYQAKAIVEYRKKKGRLKSLRQLALYEEFSERDFERMGHYVCFE